MRLLSIPWMGVMNVSLTPDTLGAAFIRTETLANQPFIKGGIGN